MNKFIKLKKNVNKEFEGNFKEIVLLICVNTLT